MFIVLCYDIIEDRRRTKLHDRLEGFLDRVQYSVFEGPLPASRYDELLTVVHEIIDHETDTVRIYHLCKGCRSLTDHIGTAEIIPEEPPDIII